MHALNRLQLRLAANTASPTLGFKEVLDSLTLLDILDGLPHAALQALLLDEVV